MKVLYIVGSQSQILEEFKPSFSFDRIVCCDRKVNPSSTFEFLHYDLLDDDSNSRVIKDASCADHISIVFSSFLRKPSIPGVYQTHIMQSILANCFRPLDLFSQLSNSYSEAVINGIFISSMYANFSPKPSNYKDPVYQNPLFYGVSKSGVEQGLRWLSCQNINHRFNSIGLGPLPDLNAQLADPELINNLKQSMPSNQIVGKSELANTINFLLNPSLISLRGSTIPLDGGYTIW